MCASALENMYSKEYQRTNNLVKKKGRRLESEAIGAIIRPKVHAFLIPIEVQVPDRKIKMKRY